MRNLIVIMFSNNYFLIFFDMTVSKVDSNVYGTK